VYFSHDLRNHAEVNRAIMAELKRRGVAVDGDTFIITQGDLEGIAGGTNALKVITVGHDLTH
jgi:pyruvate kinase